MNLCRRCCSAKCDCQEFTPQIKKIKTDDYVSALRLGILTTRDIVKNYKPLSEIHKRFLLRKIDNLLEGKK